MAKSWLISVGFGLFLNSGWTLPISGSSHSVAITNDTLQIQAKGPYLDVVEEFTVTPQNDSTIQFNIPINNQMVLAGFAADLGNGFIPLQYSKSDTTSSLNQSNDLFNGALDSSFTLSYNYQNYSSQYVSNGLLFSGAMNHLHGSLRLKFHWLQNTLSRNQFLISSILGTNQSFSIVLNTPDSNHWYFANNPIQGIKTVLLDHADTLFCTLTDRIWWTQLSGSLAGQYLSWRALIPDSISQRFQKKAELVILWRWNTPSNFFDQQGNLTSTGQTALDQAITLDNFVETRRASGIGVGLIHSVFSESPKSFKVLYQKDSTTDSLDLWLKHWTSQVLRNKYFSSTVAQENPSWKPIHVMKVNAELDSLYSHLKLAVAQFQDSIGVIREVMLVSPDGQSSTNPSLSIDSLYQILGSSSFFPVGNWLGLDLSSTLKTDPHLTYLSDGSYYWPQTKPNSFQEYLIGDSKYQLSMDSVFLARSGSWNPKIHLVAFDQSGSAIDSTDWTPQWTQLDNDSNLVRLWANTNSHLGGNAIDSISQKLGIIQNGVALAMGNSPVDNSGIWTNSILGLNPTAILDQFTTPQWQMANGQWQIWLPSGQWALCLSNISGEILGQWHLQGLTQWTLPSAFVKQNLILQIRNQNANSWSIQLGILQ